MSRSQEAMQRRTLRVIAHQKRIADQEMEKERERDLQRKREILARANNGMPCRLTQTENEIVPHNLEVPTQSR